MARWWKSAPADQPPPAVPDSQRVYAVGDIHGRADLLDAMAGLVARDLESRPVAAPLTIFLGDYVDRGPSASLVIERLATGHFPTPIACLRGNHEDVLIGFLTGEIDLGYYEQLGGAATLASYGVDPDVLASASAAQRDAILEAAVPDAHCVFLDGLRLSATVGDYFFCHAGVRPGVALDRQSAEDLLWIRQDFLRSTADFGKIVVHGHTPVREPHVRPNGINVDTHAFSSGVLSAVVLEGTDIRFLRTGG